MSNVVRAIRADRSRSEVLTAGRMRVAEAFDAILRARVDVEDYSASNCAIAAKLGVVEKQVREYRSGDKALPVGALYAMPRSIALELLDAVRAEVERR